MEVKKLSNGVELPLVGLGTHGIPNEQLFQVIDIAYRIGYKKFDTAWLYQNEDVIGEAIRQYCIPRKELFLTSKLHINDLYFKGYHRHIPNIRVKSVKKAFEQTCKRLGTDYIDLYLIHWPFPHFEMMWEELVMLYEAGRIRSIGVCSFLPQHIDELMKHTDIIPHVNQYEMTPINTQVPQTLSHQNRGIHTEAYSLFGTTKSNEKVSLYILENDIIKNISEHHDKTPNQVILRWAIQRGFSVIPRSKSEKHLKENLEIFDFELSKEEMDMIGSLNQDKYSRGNPKVNYYG